MTIELRDYQVQARDRALPILVESGGFGLFMEQRTGKTITSLATMKELAIHSLIIICPKRAIPVWESEIPRVFGSKPPKFLIINFESAWRREKELLASKFQGMIIDESHRIKDRGSEQSKFCWKLAKKVPYRLILTGTLIGNGYEDLYSQFKVIDPKLWTTWGGFESHFLIQERLELPGRPMFKRIVGYRNTEELEAALVKYSFRITRAEIEKPKPIRIKKYLLDFKPETRQHYRDIEKKLITMVQDKEVTTPIVLTQALRLHQLCGGFLTDDEGEVHVVGSEKLEALEALLRDSKYESVNWVIVVKYIAEISSISALGKRLGMDTREISGRAQYDPSMRPKMTILQVQSGIAIDLSYASHLVIFSQDYSFLNFSQFKDRIIRLGGTAPTYHFLMMKNSMDQVVYDAVFEKKKLAEKVNQAYSLSPLNRVR